MSENKGLRNFGTEAQDWASVTGDDQTDGEVVRITLDIPAEDAAFLKRLAAYRNVKDAANKVRRRTQWSAKGIAESFVSAGVTTNRQAMKDYLDVLGPLPEEKDREAMAAFVTRANELDKKLKK